MSMMDINNVNDKDMFSLMEQAMGQSIISKVEISEDVCPTCQSQDLVIDRDTTICQKCGTDLGGFIDFKPEWSNDLQGEDKSRCGMAINEMFLESSYGIGISMNGYSSAAYKNIQRAVIWGSMPPAERSLKNRLENMQLNCRDAEISQAIIDYAQVLYYKVFRVYEEHPEYKSRRGKNNEGLQAAALFFAFQKSGVHKTYKEIASIFRIHPKYLSDGIKIFNSLVNDNNTQITIYSDYIVDFCIKLGLDKRIQTRVTEIADKADSLGILENNAPTSIVAGCIYYVTVEQALSIKKNIIAEKCDVSGPTITKVCDKLFPRARDLS